MKPADSVLPKTEPAITGHFGMAWALDVPAIAARYPKGPPAQLTVAAWLVYAPYAHPLWHSYMCCAITLREFPGLSPAKINLEGATHEVMLLALDPDHPMVLDDKPRPLMPANFIGQFIEPTDEAAAARIRQAVQDVVDAKLNPDTDYTQHWIHRFSASNIKGDPKRAGETRIVVEVPGQPPREMVIPPHPGPQDMH